MRNRRTHRGPTRSKQRALLAGILRVNSRGAGSVETAEGAFYIPDTRLGEAMNGDRVQLRPLPGAHGSMRLGAVLHVLDRAHATFAAEYREDGPLRVLVPLDERLLHDFVVEGSDPAPAELGLASGDLVAARVVRYPTRKAAGVATPERRFDAGSEGEVGVEAVIAEHGLAVEFPRDVLDEAAGLRLDVVAALAEPGRRDVRDRLTVTVDPDDARDFDDALSCEPLPGGGWLLGVHIADVSAYVARGSALDREACERGTSVYLADRVLPMLPEELSCNLCSLRPGESRLAVTVDLALDAQGKVRTAEMYPSVVCSDARLTYRQVDALLEGRALPGGPENADAAATLEAFAEAQADPAAFFAELDRIRALREALRRERGAIEFVGVEAKTRLDGDGRPVGVDVRRATPATKLVEEAMLAANEAVARRLDASGLPAPFRVHEPPARDALAALVAPLREVGCLGAGQRAGLLAGDPHAIQAVLDGVAGRPEEELVSQMLLRAMRRAAYAPADEGHYGLGASAYCHFTSPIRRYPDLAVHRTLKALLVGGMKARDRRELEAALPGVCRHASKTERVAAAAAQESQDVKLAEYMEGFIGQSFEGVVVSVQPFGVFVRLRETCAEGLLHVRDLGAGPWDFDAERCELACDGAAGRDGAPARYRLGQSLWVRVRSTDPLRGKVDFALPGR